MDIYVDPAGNQLLTQAAAITRMQFLPGNQLNDTTLRLWNLQRTGSAAGPLQVAAIDAVISAFASIVVICRPLKDLNATDPLFSAVDFTAVGSDETLHYEATLNLDTTTLAALFTDSTTATVAALLDVVYLSADATVRETQVAQFPVTIYRALYLGTEGVPTSGSPSYPAPSAIALKAPVNGGYFIDSAALFKLWNPTQAIYQTIWLDGAPGAETLHIGAS
jgi:hypothetical protein